MENDWNLALYAPQDLYQLAVILESRGIDFYGRLISISLENGVKQELLFLQGEEEQHKAFFEKLVGPAARPASLLNDLAGQLLGREVLYPLEKLFDEMKVSQQQEALRFGVKMEQLTIAFYLQLKKVSAPSMTEDLDFIVSQEEKHKQKLTIILAH